MQSKYLLGMFLHSLLNGVSECRDSLPRFYCVSRLSVSPCGRGFCMIFLALKKCFNESHHTQPELDCGMTIQGMWKFYKCARGVLVVVGVSV